MVFLPQGVSVKLGGVDILQMQGNLLDKLVEKKVLTEAEAQEIIDKSNFSRPNSFVGVKIG